MVTITLLTVVTITVLTVVTITVLSVVTITVLTVQRISPDWPGVKTALDRVESEYPPSYSFTLSSHDRECQVPTCCQIWVLLLLFLQGVSGTLMYCYCQVGVLIALFTGGLRYPYTTIIKFGSMQVSSWNHLSTTLNDRIDSMAHTRSNLGISALLEILQT